MQSYATNFRKKTLSFLPAFTFLLAACVVGGPGSTLVPTPTATLILFHTSTPQPTRRFPTLESSISGVTGTPFPTATPFTHVIARGDTMGSIALKYGVNLQDLLAANPTTDPHFLTVGKTVVIPIQGNDQDPGILPTLTPVPVHQSDPRCYRVADGGAWCFVRIANNQNQAIENLSAQVALYSPSGKLISSQTALAPLNLLPAGMSLPLATYFPMEVPVDFAARADLLSALLVEKGDPRYLKASVRLEHTTISQDGRQASVEGSLIFPSKKLPAKVIWLAVVAYNVDGDVVGMRRFELNQPSFRVSVFSLGPAIHRVDALVEARP